jgi:hypothetical protein
MEKYRSILQRIFHRSFAGLSRVGIWENRRLLLVVALVLLVAAVAANVPPRQPPAFLLQVTGTPAAQIAPTSTPVSVAVTNQNMTSGLIIGGVILVLIIIGGTLGVIRRKSSE